MRTRHSSKPAKARANLKNIREPFLWLMNTTKQDKEMMKSSADLWSWIQHFCWWTEFVLCWRHAAGPSVGFSSIPLGSTKKFNCLRVSRLLVSHEFIRLCFFFSFLTSLVLFVRPTSRRRRSNQQAEKNKIRRNLKEMEVGQADSPTLFGLFRSLRIWFLDSSPVAITIRLRFLRLVKGFTIAV